MQKKLFNRVLIIDDDSVSCYISSAILEEMNAAEEVSYVTDPIEGLEFIKSRCTNQHSARADCPDLILLDINMPQLNAFEFLDELQALGKDNLIQKVVVILSSSINTKDINRINDYQVRGYIEKPLTENNLIKALNTSSH